MEGVVDEAAGARVGYPPLIFTIPEMTVNSTPLEFQQLGMGGVFTLANLTLDAIFPSYTQFLNYIENYEDFKNVSSLDIPQLVLDNRGPLAFVASTAFLALFFTLGGLLWCCAKMCPKSCTSSNRPEELIAAKLVQKRDKCKRATSGVLFATFVILLMFGLVCCFVTNEQMKEAVVEIPNEVNGALMDTKAYVKTTSAQIEALFISNYETLAALLYEILNQSGEILKNGLSERTGAQALNNLSLVLETVDSLQESLKAVQDASGNLKIKANQLTVGLRKSRDNLMNLLGRCESLRCQQLKSTPEIASLRVQNDFQNIPDMSEILREVQELLQSKVRTSIEKGRLAFDSLGVRLKSEVEPVIPEVRRKIAETGKDLANVSKTLTAAMSSLPLEDSSSKVEEYEKIIIQYAPYLFYSVLGVCIMLTFIFTLFVFGIFIGFCGKQPGSESSDECCSRKTGTTFLNCGTFWIFLTYGILSAVAIVYFIVAGFMTQVICEAIDAKDNRTETALHLPKIDVRNKHGYVMPSYSSIIDACERGESAYMAFKLESVYDIKNIGELNKRFKKEVNRLVNKVHLSQDATQGIVFLTPEAHDQLDKFAISAINRFDFSKFANELNDNIVPVDLKEVIMRLNASLIDPGLDSDELKSEMRNEIMILQAYQTGLLEPMMKDVRASATNLRILAKEQKDLTQRVKEVADAAQKAQDKLQSSTASTEIRELAKRFEREFVGHIDSYASFTEEAIVKKVGECGPLFGAWNRTTGSACIKLGLPLSAFWLSLTAILILFIPLTLLAIQLAGLYSKFKNHSYESETYYSAYGDGDTIPLSANARRPKRGRGHPVDSRLASRFEDTSHKAWGSQLVFNSHHTPPASGEYERPPPYYYPGPAH